MGPRSFPLTSYFPNRPGVKVRPGASTDGWSYVEWFEECRKRKLPMRVIIIYDSGYTVNMACLINDFKWSVGTNKDIKYSMDVVEYTFALSKKLEESTIDNSGEDDDQVKWDEFAASEEYAFLQRLVRRSKEEEPVRHQWKQLWKKPWKLDLQQVNGHRIARRVKRLCR